MCSAGCELLGARQRLDVLPAVRKLVPLLRRHLACCEPVDPSSHIVTRTCNVNLPNKTERQTERKIDRQTDTHTGALGMDQVRVRRCNNCTCMREVTVMEQINTSPQQGLHRSLAESTLTGPLQSSLCERHAPRHCHCALFCAINIVSGHA